MIYRYQAPAFAKLKQSARALELATEMKLAIKPRFHRLIIGPTGTGKTFLADQLADWMSWPRIKINCASWIVLGARETPTWETLQQWAGLYEGNAHAVIILDELDKIWGHDQWTRNCRAEIFDLCDWNIPQQTRSPELEATLETALIVGCGAFQEMQDKPEPVGFHPAKAEEASLKELSKHMPPEILNRFHPEVIATNEKPVSPSRPKRIKT